MSDGVDRLTVRTEMERARLSVHSFVSAASPVDLRRRTDGTRWTNRQMLFHMVFGYMVVLRLLGLVRLFGRLPDPCSRMFAGFHGHRLEARADRVVAALHLHLDRKTDESLARHMHFPVDWDPFFTETMTLLDVYHYGTQHFDFHARQLTLPPGPDRTPTRG